MDYRRDFPDQCEYIRGYRVNLGPSRAIRKSLEVFGLKHWGFVILRCTYSSQEKWDRFVAELKEQAQDYLEARQMKDLCDTMAWTIIEDPETLDGASTLEAARKFEEWREERSPEMREKDVASRLSLCPRYDYFVHGNEASVESVVDDAMARKKEGYYFTLINLDDIMNEEEEKAEREVGDGEEEEGEEGGEVSSEMNEEDAFLDNIYVEQRFKADQVVGLYAHLLELDNWYEMLVLESLVTDTAWS